MMSASIGRRIGETILFSDRLESDERTPCVTFSVPPIILGGRYKYMEIGFIMPEVQFWIALVVVSCLDFKTQ